MKQNIFLSGVLVVAVGCSSSVPATPVRQLDTRHSFSMAANESLVAYDNSSGDIEEWNVTPSGGTEPSVLAAPAFTTNVVAMAGAGSYGTGSEVVLASLGPSEAMYLYDPGTNAVKTHAALMQDPVDIVSIIGGAAFALFSDGSYETMPFDRGAPRPANPCDSILSTATAITADKAGDVLIQGAGPGGFAGVAEVDESTQTCSALSLKPQKGTAAGITVDPATNDLIVGDNPRSCSGGSDGRLIVYPPPYTAGSGTIHRLSGVNCAGLFRIDSGKTGDTYIFMLDTNGTSTQIDELLCCGTMTLEGSYSGGEPSAPTTLPDSLPNG